MSRAFSSLIPSIALGAILILSGLVGCAKGGGSSNGPGTGGGNSALTCTSTAATTAGQAVFTSQVYPIISKTVSCESCHAPGQSESAIPLADGTNSTNAYNAARAKLDNISTPSQSTFYTYGIQNNHCGEANCTDPSGTLKAAINSWAAAELGASNCGSSTSPTAAGYTTVGTVSVDSGLVNASGAPITIAATDTTTVAYLKYDLSAAGGTGATLYFTVKRYQTSPAASYLVSSPSIVSATSYFVSGIKLWLNNGSASTAYSIWTGVAQKVAALTTFPGTSVDTLFAVVLAGGAAGDSFQVGIQTIGASQ